MTAVLVICVLAVTLILVIAYSYDVRAKADMWRRELGRERELRQLFEQGCKDAAHALADLAWRNHEQRKEIKMLRELPQRFPRTMNWLTPGGSA